MLNQLCYSIGDMLKNPVIITSLVFMAVGLALSILSKRITLAVRKTQDLQQNDKLLLGLRAMGLVLIMVGLFLLIAGLLP